MNVKERETCPLRLIFQVAEESLGQQGIHGVVFGTEKLQLLCKLFVAPHPEKEEEVTKMYHVKDNHDTTVRDNDDDDDPVDRKTRKHTPIDRSKLCTQDDDHHRPERGKSH